MAKIANPRKAFNFSIVFPKHPMSPYLCQKCTMPDIEIEQVKHGDTNHDVKTAGRVTVGNMTMEKLTTTDGSDTWLFDWLMSAQDMYTDGGNVPSVYKETMSVMELAEDGTTVLNTWICEGVWPCKVSGIELDRTSSENTVEKIEFSVDYMDKV